MAGDDCPKCGKPSASPPAEVYCVDCATEGWEQDAAAHRAVMAGDGGRVPDVSEQRADVICGTCGSRCMAENCDRYAPSPDPASVLAALLAESPEATVAAIEALLTSDEAVDPIALKLRGTDGGLDWRSHVRSIVVEAVRSLLSKAPKEDG